MVISTGSMTAVTKLIRQPLFFEMSFHYHSDYTVTILLHKIAPRGSASIAAGTLMKTATQNRHFREEACE